MSPIDFAARWRSGKRKPEATASAARWGLRLALALNTPPFGLRRASLQPEPQRGRVSLNKRENAKNRKDQNKDHRKERESEISNLEWAK